jgi:heme/copper-type cytochrome/quinol oxidase subunit 2
MTRGKQMLLTAALVLAAAAAPVVLATTSGRVPRRVDVEVKGFTDGARTWHFTPRVIYAHLGDTLHVKFEAEGAGHGFRLAQHTSEVDLTAYPGMPVETSFVVDWVGGREFYCTFDCGPGHAQMSGMIISER